MNDINTAYNENPGFFKRLFTGRMNRLPFFGFGILINFATVVVNAIFIVLVQESAPGDELGLSLIALCIFIIIIFFSLPIIWRRLHDLNLPGPLAFVIILFIFGNMVPEVDFIFNILLLISSIMLVFVRGTVGSNKYGPDPLGGVNVDKEMVEEVFGDGSNPDNMHWSVRPTTDLKKKPVE